jgi:hypothetical protein
MNNTEKLKIQKLVQFSTGEIDMEDHILHSNYDQEDLYIANLLRENRTLLGAISAPVPEDEVNSILLRMKNKEAVNQVNSDKSTSKFNFSRFNITSLFKNKLVWIPVFSILLLAVFFLPGRLFTPLTDYTSEFKGDTFYKTLQSIGYHEIPLLVGSSQKYDTLKSAYSHQILSLYESKKTYKKSISKYRPPLSSNLQEGSSASKELKRLEEFALIQEKNQTTDPVVWNNIGLVYYYLADIEIRYYLSSNTWRDKKNTEAYLKHSIDSFTKALSMPRVDIENVSFNLSAVKIAGLHLDGYVKKDVLASILSDFIENPTEIMTYLSSNSKQEVPEIELKKSGVSLPLRKFLVAYLLVLNYSYFEEAAIDDLPEQVKLEKAKLLQLLDKTISGEGSEYWGKELIKIKERLKNQKILVLYVLPKKVY